MLRRLVALTVVAAVLVPVPSSAAEDPLVDAPGALQLADRRPYVTPGPVEPDYAYSPTPGTRVEIYSSVGDNDVAPGEAFGDQDWRPINAYAYLVASVPPKQQLYTTVYNALNDFKRAAKGADDRWGVVGARPDEVQYSPTQAFLDVVNQYVGLEDESGDPILAKDFVHVLGNKTSMGDAVKAPSSLATLVTQATDYRQCSTGSGACLTTRTSGENYMHAKYAAFEQTRDSTGALRDNVVWITSANLNGASGGKKSNLSIAVYGDSVAYDSLVKLWNFEADRDKKGYFASGQIGEQGVETKSGIRLFPSPRSNGGDLAAVDYEAKVLREATTASLARTAPGQARTGCRVYAVHSLFSRDDVVDALAQLQADACDVRVVLGTNAISDVTSYYFETSARLRTLVSRVQFANVHDKTLSVSYQRGGTPVSATFGGSANFNGTSLQYDELAFRSDDRSFAQVVQRHSERLYQLAQGADRAVGVRAMTFGVESVTAVRGETYRVKPVITPSNASVRTVTWSSDDPDIARVDQTGTITGLAEGTTVVRGLSLSGGYQDSVVVQVVAPGAGTTTPADGTPSPTTVVTTPPELSMEPTQSPGQTTDTVITWSQGNRPLDGTVRLEYYASGSWKRYRDISITSGRWTDDLAFLFSHTWRARGISVRGSGVSLPKAVVRGFVPSVVRTKGATEVLRAYAPDLVVKGTKVLYTVSWDNPYAGRKGINNNVRLQYYTGSRWVTAATFAMPAGKINMDVSWPAVKSRKWRFASGITSQPSSVKAKVSSPILVTTAAP